MPLLVEHLRHQLLTVSLRQLQAFVHGHTASLDPRVQVRADIDPVGTAKVLQRHLQRLGYAPLIPALKLALRVDVVIACARWTDDTVAAERLGKAVEASMDPMLAALLLRPHLDRHGDLVTGDYLWATHAWATHIGRAHPDDVSTSDVSS